jgi:hypothetical protein
MMTRTHPLQRPAALFTISAAAVVACALAILRTRLGALNPDIAAWGVTFDLTITIPLLYYFFVVRGGQAKAITIVPLFVACMALAAIIIPRGQQAFLHQLRLVAAPLDIVTIVLVVRRIAAMRRAGSAPDDVYERIDHAARGIFGNGPAAAFVTTEVTLIYYALFAWRAQPRVPADARAVTIHKRSEWGTIVACIIVLIAFESVGLHLLVQHWSAKAAWILTALDVYGVLWLIGDYHAMRLRPTLAGRDAIEFRHGLRWSVTVSRDNIASVDTIESEADWKRKATVKFALLDAPRTMIRLREPVVAHGLAGIRKRVDSIAILADDPAELERALALH